MATPFYWQGKVTSWLMVLIEVMVLENAYSISRDSDDLSFIADSICGCNADFMFGDDYR
ncbi:MAG: hypothetical protein L3J89_07915 [Gammaproteobacteria bacterium]|nr:hypothetical protein [Gammaproteobacteria bacterium]